MKSYSLVFWHFWDLPLMGLPILKPAFSNLLLHYLPFLGFAFLESAYYLMIFSYNFILINDEKGGCYFWTMQYSILVCYNNSKKIYFSKVYFKYRVSYWSPISGKNILKNELGKTKLAQILNFEIMKLKDTTTNWASFLGKPGTYLEQTLVVLHTFLPGLLQFLEEEKSRLYYSKVCVSAIPLGLFWRASS